MEKNYVEGVIGFFKSDFWTNFVSHHLVHPENPEDEVYHSHIYCDSSIHPDTMHKLMFAYFQAIGHPLTRRIDPISPHANQIGLHSVYPQGLAHFDLYMRWNEDVVLGPMPEDAPDAENGHNCLSWGKVYQDEFLAQGNFHFKTVGPREETMIREYFKGTHWKETQVHVLDPDINHCHMNVEINFDPKVLELIARDELAKIGWTVERVVPCVYDVHGTYRGKLVFLLGRPEEVFDIAWKYNPNVVIRRAPEPWVRDTAGFDCWPDGGYKEKVAAGNFYRLSDAELEKVIASFSSEV